METPDFYCKGKFVVMHQCVQGSCWIVAHQCVQGSCWIVVHQCVRGSCWIVMHQCVQGSCWIVMPLSGTDDAAFNIVVTFHLISVT